MFWIFATGMTAAAVLAGLWPLARRARDTRSGSDIEVYRDQLNEIERDRTLGLIGAAEAEAARIEVSRRLIAAAEAPAQQPFRMTMPRCAAAAAGPARSRRAAASRRRSPRGASTSLWEWWQ